MEEVRSTPFQCNGKTYNIKVFAATNGYEARAFIDNQPYGYTLTVTSDDFFEMILSKQPIEEFYDDLTRLVQNCLQDGSWERYVNWAKKPK